MSTIPLALPSLNTNLISPDEDAGTLLGESDSTLTPGLGTSNEQTPLSILQQIENIPGTVSKGLGMSGSGSIFGSSGWLGLRGVTIILGFLLIAAGLFAHPAIREKIVEGGKLAAAAAA